jgi:hypothetical protein
MFKKLDLSKLRNLKRQSMFLALALVMCILVGGFVVYGILFIASKIDSSLEVQPPAPSTLKFDIEGFNKLKLIR